MGNEAICVGHRRYIHFFACFLFLNEHKYLKSTRIPLWALLLEVSKTTNTTNTTCTTDTTVGMWLLEV